MPFLDVGAAYRELKVEIDAAVQRVLDSGCYVLGPEVEAFEAEWADYCNVAHAVGVGNGLDALILALRALGVGPGDDVIVPSNTYIATWLAVTAVGARPVPVEPDPTTHNINAESVSSAITLGTKVVLAVHLYGQPVDLDPILELAKSRNLYVVEDAAQAHGASYRGRKLGGHGDVVCWSFYPGKNLGAMGDAGAITTNSSDIAEQVRTLRNYGSRQKYVNDLLGVNSRLDPLQAVVLRTKLPYLDEWTERRRAVARRYTTAFREAAIALPVVPEWAEPAWHLYVIRSTDRDRLQVRLTEAGIGTLIHYPIPPHEQKAYAATELGGLSFPIASRLAREVLSLPVGPQLSNDDVERVILAVTAGCER